jgi:hypothetical protein
VIVTDAVPPIWAKSRSPPWNNAVRRRHSIRVKLRRAAHRIDLEVSIDPLPEQRVRDGIKLSGRCVFAGLTGSQRRDSGFQLHLRPENMATI